MTTIKHSTGFRLRMLRNEKNLKQAVIAETIGVSLRAYGMYERSKVLPPTDTLIDLSIIFNVSVDFLLCRTDFRTGPSGEYFSKLTGLSDDAIRALIENRISAGIEGTYIAPTVFQADPPAPSEYNTLPDTVSYLLRPENQDVLIKIGTYIQADDLVLSDDLPPVLRTRNVNGNGIEFDTIEVLRSALPNMILQRLNDLRHDRLKNRTKKAGPETENPTENKSSTKEGNEND